ncbi:MAG: DNA replication and repair protein RecF [Flavobacteriales bacterium]|nr:DNA replication and repair protein RecF [Flavobacteriales bacterium]
MYIQKLKINQFKNLEFKEVEFSSKFNLIVGKNGSGKSSILDAIHYLSLTKSCFISSDLLNINFDSDFFTLEGNFTINNQENRIKINVQKGQKKIVKFNEKAYTKLSEHIGKIPLVVISPYDSDLISLRSETRRKFIDNVLSQVDSEYLNALILYQKTIQQRNSLLKSFQQNNYFDYSLLEIYNEPLIKNGNYIHKKRIEFCDEFSSYFVESYESIVENNSEKVAVCYTSPLLKKSQEELLKENLENDRRTGFTTKGIHKDDLDFLLHNHQIKKIGSQGQQKTFLIALKFAQFKYLHKNNSQKPLLLLDDIFDKLDANRVRKLIELVNTDSFGQVFISHTKKEEIESIFEDITNEKHPTIEL